MVILLVLLTDILFVLLTDMLVVAGQTNSRKKFSANELRGGSFMPTSEVPSTSGIVHLKRSQENYIQVRKDGSFQTNNDFI